MLRQGSESQIESQVKLISERVKNIEKSSAQLRTAFAEIAHLEAEIRDKYDEVSRISKDLAETEVLDLSLVTALHAISNTFTILADNKNIEAQRLVVHVESEFAQYGNICKKIKESLKECNKEPIVPRVQRRTGMEMATVDSKLIKSSVDQKRILNELCDTFETFEQRKVQDFKSILHNLLLILLKANTSSIDPLTYSTKSVLDIDEALDLKKLKESFQKQNPGGNGLARQTRFRSRSMSALSSIFKTGKKPMLTQSTTSINSSEMSRHAGGRNRMADKDHHYGGMEDDDDEDEESETETSVSSEPEERSRTPVRGNMVEKGHMKFM